MSRTLIVAVAVASLTMGSTTAYAGIDPDVRCRDKKVKVMAKNAFDLLKAFGKNGKKPNVVKLTRDLSKSRSKLTKSFTKAEFTRRGDDKGCATTNDVSTVEGKVETYVEDVLDETGP